MYGGGGNTNQVDAYQYHGSYFDPEGGKWYEYDDKLGRYYSTEKYSVGRWVDEDNYIVHEYFADRRIYSDEDPYQNSHGLKVYSAKEFWIENRDKSYAEIINQELPKDGLPGGPSMRMVRNPNDGRIMDMRHVMVIGFGGSTIYRGNPLMGNIVGLGAEIVQWLGPIFGNDTRGSAFDKQDFYSNNIGAMFSTHYWYTGKFMKDWSLSFYQWLKK